MANEVLASELREYEQGAQAYVHALKDKGVKFAEAGVNQQRIDALREQLRAKGAQFKNVGASIV